MRQVQGKAEDLWTSGEKAEKAGNIMDALIYYQAAVDKYSDMGMDRKVATLQSKIGDCLSQSRKFRDATAFYRQSLNILHVYGSESEIGDCYYRLGLCHMNLGRNEEAVRHLEAAEFCFKRSGDRSKRDEIKSILSSIGP
jgi:tetratricopeptide (TPR) repeat protein